MASFVPIPLQELSHPPTSNMPNQKIIAEARTRGVTWNLEHLKCATVLALPDLPMCISYSNYYTNYMASSGKVGITVLPRAMWRDQFGEDALRTLIDSMIERGRPTVHWYTVWFSDNENAFRGNTPQQQDG